jgi:hypothetical protein
MTPRRTRLTRRGTAVISGMVLVLAGLGVFTLIRSSEPDCTVTAAGRTVELDQDKAEKVSAAVAAVVRRSGSATSAARAVTSSIQLFPADAKAVASALTGRTKAALSCRYGSADHSEPDGLGADGLTHRAETVRKDMAAHFGDLPLGGFAPGGVHTGHMVGSAHYEGRAIDTFFRPINAPNKQHGWALAQYLVANAARLEINTVIFDGQIWTAAKGDQGWRSYTVSHANKSIATIRILEHRDHVHVDVAD